MSYKLLFATLLLLLLGGGFSVFRFFIEVATIPLTLSRIPQGGHFRVETQRGLLDTRSLKDKTLFLFFGFARCPHVCPTTLYNLKRMIHLLPRSEREKIVVLFLSVDPLDTKEILKEKLEGFGEAFYAATPDPENLSYILQLYGARFKRYPASTPEETAFDQTSSVFVINSRGVWVNSLKYDSSPEEFKRAYEAAPEMSPIYAKHRQHQMVEEVGSNEDCDLGLTDCQIDYWGTNLKVTLSPRPIIPEQNYRIIVTSSNEAVRPIEADFEGIELNMGLIRPKLTKSFGNHYEGNFFIPVCELEKMKWKLNLLVEDETGVVRSLRYHFHTDIKATP